MTSLLRAALSSTSALKSVRQSQGVSSLLRSFPRLLSTEAQNPSQSATFGSPSADSFLGNPSTGLIFGRLVGIDWHMTKTDALTLLEGGNLTVDDIKVAYDRNYIPTEMIIQFPSLQAFNAAIRSIRGKGRLYRLEETNRNHWDIVRPYDGKAILLLGIPRNAQMEHIERFLSGTQHDSSSIQFFNRQAFPESIRIALVRFPSQALAMNAFMSKNLGFCLNNKIWIQVLQ